MTHKLSGILWPDDHTDDSGIIQASSDLKCGSCINDLIFHSGRSLN